jgi:lipooligosaccharide transport system ATP-binding protein
MHEAELLCDRIVILNRGTLIGAGPPRDLIAEHAPGFVGTFAREDESKLREHITPGMHLYQQGWQTCVRGSSIEELGKIQSVSATRALQLRPANLEDVYLKLTGQDLGDNE